MTKKILFAITTLSMLHGAKAANIDHLLYTELKIEDLYKESKKEMIKENVEYREAIIEVLQKDDLKIQYRTLKRVMDSEIETSNKVKKSILLLLFETNPEAMANVIFDKKFESNYCKEGYSLEDIGNFVRWDLWRHLPYNKENQKYYQVIAKKLKDKKLLCIKQFNKKFVDSGCRLENRRKWEIMISLFLADPHSTIAVLFGKKFYYEFDNEKKPRIYKAAGLLSFLEEVFNSQAIPDEGKDKYYEAIWEGYKNIAYIDNEDQYKKILALKIDEERNLAQYFAEKNMDDFVDFIYEAFFDYEEQYIKLSQNNLFDIGHFIGYSTKRLLKEGTIDTVWEKILEKTDKKIKKQVLGQDTEEKEENI